MRNLDIIDTRDKLRVYTETGLIGAGRGDGMPLLVGRRPRRREEVTAVKKAWAVLAYTIAEDAATASVLDTSAQRELKAICDAADFGRVSVAAQVDFKRRRGVYRSALIEIPPGERGFSDIDPERPPILERHPARRRRRDDRRRLQRDATDLNAADADVLQEFLRFGQDGVSRGPLRGVVLRPRRRAARASSRMRRPARPTTRCGCRGW